MDIWTDNAAFKVGVYRNFWRQWRWKIKAGNNKTIAASTESFKNREDCLHNMKLLKQALNGFIQG